MFPATVKEENVVLNTDNAKSDGVMPGFSWMERFPKATVVDLVDSDAAANFLQDFIGHLWERACSEGDVALGFDIEWTSIVKGSCSHFRYSTG